MNCECGSNRYEWDRNGEMAYVLCTDCGTYWLIPQCCDNEKCGGDCK